jgi:aspartyl-tRNA(Asn)/glutamyl-tRNA(Gln) amidotransferase subunit A
MNIFDINLEKETVKSLRIKLDRREIGAREVCEEYLELINALNPDLGAFISVTEEAALAVADSAQSCIDKGEGGALTGIPGAVADNILTSGILTTCASKMLEDFISPYDAGVIETLQNISSPLLGKSSIDEFTVGGSPKSGAAVYAGMAPFALASDTGGAIRRAAAFDGLTGLRPTYGRVSRFGLAAFASSLDQISPIAQTAEDCAIILNEIAVSDKRDVTCFGNPSGEDFTEKIGAGVKGLKIALPKEFFGENASGDIKKAVLDAAKELEKQGAELLDISVEILNYALPAYYIISSAEAAGNLSRYDGVNFGLRGEGATYFEQICDSRSRGFGNEVKRRIMFGNFVLSHENYKDYFLKALALRQKLKAEYDEVFKTADAIITPTIPETSLSALSNTEPVKAYSANMFMVPPALAGLPAASVTCGYDMRGTPIGMQLTGKKCGEQTVIQIADCFERIYNPDLFLI